MRLAQQVLLAQKKAHVVLSQKSPQNLRRNTGIVLGANHSRPTRPGCDICPPADASGLHRAQKFADELAIAE